MGKSKISKLALAIAAAGFLSGALPAQAYEMDAATVVQTIVGHAMSALPDQAYEMDAATVVQTIVGHAMSERTELALEMIDRLRALGITEIVIDGETISLARLEAAVIDPDGFGSALILNQLLALSAGATASSFVAGTIVVASVDSEAVLVDAFPVGSVG